MNCFAAKTIPIYYGCPSIEKFFNPDGIIFIEKSTVEAIEKAVGLCSVQDYENKIERKLLRTILKEFKNTYSWKTIYVINIQKFLNKIE